MLSLSCCVLCWIFFIYYSLPYHFVFLSFSDVFISSISLYPQSVSSRLCVYCLQWRSVLISVFFLNFNMRCYINKLCLNFYAKLPRAEKLSFYRLSFSRGSIFLHTLDCLLTLYVRNKTRISPFFLSDFP